MFESRQLKACYGTTKYCTFFLKRQECPNRPDCYFLHEFQRECEIEEGKHKPNKEMFELHLKIAQKIVSSSRAKVTMMMRSDEKTVFPTVAEILREYDTDGKENPESPVKESTAGSFSDIQ